MAAPRDLVTVLYRPRATMRRVLDAGGNRWSLGLVVVAALSASVGDPDIRRLRHALPQFSTETFIALILGSIAVIALAWIAVLYLCGWMAAAVGRVLGGPATAADMRAALAWGIVPSIWAVIYRVPVAVYKDRLLLDAAAPRDIVANFLSNGGCSLIVVILALQTIFFVWSAWVMSSTVAEVQRFSTAKGFANLALTAVVPVAIVAAAVIASHVR